jgi:hypothetical protein
MFKRGGSVSEGTGITSGLEPRRGLVQHSGGYAGDGEEDYDLENQTLSNDSDVIPVANQPIPTTSSNPVMGQRQYPPEVAGAFYDMMKQKTMPTKEQVLANMMTAFGASAGSPTELQTWGSAAGKAAQNYATLNEPLVREANKYGAQAAIAALKGMTKEDALAVMKKAKLAAQAGMFGGDVNKALIAFLQKELTTSSPFLKVKSPADQRYDEILRIKDEARKEGRTLTEPEAIAKAELNIKLRNDPTFEKLVREGRFAGQLSRTFITDQEDGSLLLKSNDPTKQVPKPELSKYKAGQIVFDPLTKNFYMYDGKGKFTLRPDISL